MTDWEFWGLLAILGAVLVAYSIADHAPAVRAGGDACACPASSVPTPTTGDRT